MFRYSQFIDKPITFFFLYALKVSWIRKEDIHILTSEDFVFSGDPRFTVIHPKESIEWNLKIDHATLKDSGFYGKYFLLMLSYMCVIWI